MNYVVTESTDDAFTIWDGKTMHPDYPGKPMGETTFMGIPGHGFKKKDIVQVVIRLVTSENQDQNEIEERLRQGAGSRFGSQPHLPIYGDGNGHKSTERSGKERLP